MEWMVGIHPPSLYCYGGRGRSTDESNNSFKSGVLSPVDSMEVWPSFPASSCRYHGDGGGGRERWRPQSYRLGQSSSPAAIRYELRRALLPSSIHGLGCGGRLPDSLPLYLLTEWRSIVVFLPAQSWLDGRQSGFVAASMSSMSTRRWRWRHGGITAPSGYVPGGGDVAAARKMVFGPDCVFNFPTRVLHAKSRDWSVFLYLLCCCFVIFNLI